MCLGFGIMKFGNVGSFGGFGTYGNLGRFRRLRKFGQEFRNLTKKAKRFANHKTVSPETLTYQIRALKSQLW